ncbi:MAG: ABC-F family ATP-binding cassette domain-containing protein [Myxococcota bacterium]
MMHLIDISKHYGPRELFSGLSWHIGHRERIGLVGPNGAGKTTLFKIVTGQIEADEGRVVTAKGVRVGYLAQETDEYADRSVLEVVIEAAGEVTALEAEKAELEAAMAGGDTSEGTLSRWEAVSARHVALGGYGVEAEARRILSGLGFADSEATRPVRELSGGWVMRVAMARLLLARPEILLLDEPTNHLDLESLLWFEGFLQDYPGSVVIISHDRYLLNRVARHIAELGRRGVDVYTGGFDDWLEQREARREMQAATAENQARAVAETERFIERFRAKSSKAKAVQSRIKALERLERVDAPESEDRSIRFRFPEPERSGKDVVVFEDAGKSYGPTKVYEGLNLTLQRGERIALVGPNGAGKSTLLKMIAGTVAPDRGEMRLGHNVSRAFFAQHQVEVLDLERTVLEEMESAADVDTWPMCRGLLGAFRFSGADVGKRVGVLSGGEKARLAMAKMMLRPANLLLMDEPTNHLDMASLAVLVQALQDYTGTLILISHDRHFIDAIATEVIEVIDGEVRRFSGSFEDYAAKKALLGEPLLGRAEAPAGGAQADARKPARDDKARKRWEAELRNAHHRSTKALRGDLEGVERRISEVETALGDLRERMMAPGFFEDSVASQQAVRDERALTAEQEELMERWEGVSLAIEEAETTLAASLEAGP